MRSIFIVAMICISGVLYAGNPERIGQAGGTQLLVNPFARSSGLNGINVSFCSGIESFITNPAGIASMKGSEIIFSHTRWMVGSGINVNSFGFGQKFRSGGAFGIGIVAFDLGEFIRTTTDYPDGTLGKFSPTYLNIGISYSHTFVDDKIFVGATVKMVHESINDVTANGVAFDAGVQYRDSKEKFKIGVALRNVSPGMIYSGDGLSTRANLGGKSPSFDNSKVATTAAGFEIPSILIIGASYDLTFGTDHKLIPTASFIANSYGYDQIGAGVEYRFKKYLALRASYIYEAKEIGAEDGRNAFTGMAGGMSFEMPLSKSTDKVKSNTSFGIDYSYRANWLFSGTHSIGFRLNF